MPTTRKKVIKTVYKDENSDEGEDGDFSDSGSDAKFSAASSSEEEEIESAHSSAEEFDHKSKKNALSRKIPPKKERFTKNLVKKISKQTCRDDDESTATPPLFSIKDLTEADKLLPSILNLSESDSSDDESQSTSKKTNVTALQSIEENIDIDYNDISTEYKDVWSNNMQVQDDSEEIAKKTFMELEQHKSKVEEAKASLQNYTLKMKKQECDVKDLLALGEEVLPTLKEPIVSKKPKFKRQKNDSDSEMEDWEEVKETKAIPQQGIQLFVEFPDAVSRKSKKIDVEMMMRRKINRVKKEYQVYMHKVHVLCWLGHGNYVSRILNDQELMAAALLLVPSKECYPSERVDMKYLEQITKWYKDKLTLKQDKNEDKFKPKAPPLKTILLDSIKKRVVTSNKYLAFIFVVMLRALGLQCRVMFNFVTLPLKPPTFELCSLSTKPKDENADKTKSTSKVAKSPSSKTNSATDKKKNKEEPKASTSKAKSKKQKIAQVDGNYDTSCSSDEEMQVDRNSYNLCNYDYENIMQVDGNDDVLTTRKTRSTKRPKSDAAGKLEEEDVSPPKIPKKSSGRKSPKPPTKPVTNIENKNTQKDIKTTNTKESGDAKVNKSKPNKNNARPKADSAGKLEEEDVSPPKISRKSPERKSPKPPTKLTTHIDSKNTQKEKKTDTEKTGDAKTNTSKPNSSNAKAPSKSSTRQKAKLENGDTELQKHDMAAETTSSNTRSRRRKDTKPSTASDHNLNIPKISVTDETKKEVASKYFENTKPNEKLSRLSRQRSQTANPSTSKSASKTKENATLAKTKGRTKSAPGTAVESSKYFNTEKDKITPKKSVRKLKEELAEDKLRVSHKDLAKDNIKGINDVTGVLVNIIKSRIKDAKSQANKGLVKGKIKQESDEDSDYLPVEEPKSRNSDSENEFKPSKISPKSSTRRIDRRVLSTPSTDEPLKKNRVDVWCEIFVEELEQWISVDVVTGKIHSTANLYSNATHPVCYIVGWDNNNYLKDLTRKYVPQYNTVTRKLRADTLWWEKAIRPYLGPKTARDREEDEYLDRMQLEAPLPKSISEYKNHPLYALKRHLLKFEAIYPPDAASLGFVRGEAVYARQCVHTCRSRDTWLKEAKVVRLGEKPYKVVKARPKWDKLSNKLITDKPLEVFGPWQVQDYEPPVAENGIVPRNAYGNVELFKDCMLPKGTAHIKLPGLNRVAKKLNIDCAPAMTGFDFNGGWSHPVYDGFVVCKEFEEIITDAWVKDQEEQERRELEKTELRVYGNWKRLIKGLLIRERLKHKYGFEEPTTSEKSKGKSKGPRLVVKKKS